ncbi:MAG: nucleotidyltransferase domain-containing protein [Chloroflexi bacterium]|nr:MAG: nucleotidyltransferase domain-containing protein [Chloroflexota bacterium]
MYTFAPAFPTPQHALAAEAITGLFARDPAVDAVLLYGSCARGKAAPGSCLDIDILLRPEATAGERTRLEALWAAHYPADPVYHEMLAIAPFSHVDLDFFSGSFDPGRHDHGWTTGADEFELEMGNFLAYSAPLWQADPGGGFYQQLRAAWLPYYNEELRRERLAMALKYCRNNLAHIHGYAPRGLYFQSFKRLYHAFEEFLQALFISRRTYPIAYDKWVKEGVVDILGLPELYERLPHLLEISHFESQEVVARARELEDIVAEYIPAEKG